MTPATVPPAEASRHRTLAERNVRNSAAGPVLEGLACPLPVQPEDTAAPMARATPLVGDAGVLIVDDDLFQLELLQFQLESLEVAPVQACNSGPAALAWLERHGSAATLLLLDLNMPGMDGVEFIRHLADRRHRGALVVFSGSDSRALETAAKLASASHLNVLGNLRKPVRLETLRGLIDRWRQFVPASVPTNAQVYGPLEIARAIDAHELVLHYQPQVGLTDGARIGVEALVRWQHRTDGLVAPDAFVGVAEAHGLIDALTHTVLELALAQARRWRDAGLALRVAVNVSMDNLTRLDFPEIVLDALTRHGVPATELVFEVTESRLMADARAPMDILARLCLKRIGLSIDDFGTGHSSLAQLRDLPFDRLKIDRTFVHGHPGRDIECAIFNASLQMAHRLGMTVVAEGVEDRADWDAVRASGCDTAQGYFVARPMPAAALPDWAAQWQQRFIAL